ncbi:MAG: autotransporter domain-containing protein [Chlamydiia bacterium]|nr:autotransporter domain-containing protein [Chlamydiia bacterium]
MKALMLLLTISATVFATTGQERPIKAVGSSIPTHPAAPGAGPRVEHGIDAFITGDFIYWTARMDGLAYVITGQGDQINSVGKGSAKYPDWRWSPGFKGGIGLNLPHDDWDVYAEYTWYQSSAINATNIRGNGMLPPWNISSILSLLENNSSITQARGKWDIHFYAIDLSLGRNYFISRFLALRPFASLKWGWVNQDYRVRYLLETTNVDSTVSMKNDQDYWGIGLRSGLNTSWHIDTSWSFYANVALSALWSQFEIDRQDTRTDTRNGGTPQPNTTIVVFNSEDSFHTIKGVIEFGMGLRGEWWFSDNRYHFMIQGGWEEQLWLNHNHLLKTHFTQSDHGDLILQGMTIKLRFDF